MKQQTKLTKAFLLLITLFFIFYSLPVLAADITVSTTVDEVSDNPSNDTGCSLREAILSANLNISVGGCTAGESTVTDIINVPAGTYTLTLNIDCPETEFSNGATCGDLNINEDLDIVGAGQDNTIIQWGEFSDMEDLDASLYQHSTHRIFEISNNSKQLNPNAPCTSTCTPSITTTIVNLTLQNGVAAGDGGAIASYNPVCGFNLLNLTNVNILNNQALTGSGGGIHSQGIVKIKNSNLLNNSANSSVGGAYFNSSTLDCPDLRNEISGSLLESNNAFVGGAIFNGFLSKLDILETTITQNSSLISGGGIMNSGSIDISKTTIDNNSTPVGMGGGISNFGYLSMMNSTLSANTAKTFGAGLANIASQGCSNGTQTSDPTIDCGADLNNVTITKNIIDIGTDQRNICSPDQQSGAGIGVLGGNVNIANTILADNQDISVDCPTGPAKAKAPDCWVYEFVCPPNTICPGTPNELISDGYNLIGDNTNCNITSSSTDKIGTAPDVIDPKLEPLALNNGSTKTHALSKDSPAVDMG